MPHMEVTVKLASMVSTPPLQQTDFIRLFLYRSLLKAEIITLKYNPGRSNFARGQENLM